jgi:hypothetical protein
MKRRMNPTQPRAFALACLTAVALVPVSATAQGRGAEIYGTYGGDPMYTVLPPGAIPAVVEPEFVSGPEANGQMSPQEPVLGLVVNGEARAYSLWQLDAHEIVNDVVGGVPVAATW